MVVSRRVDLKIEKKPGMSLWSNDFSPRWNALKTSTIFPRKHKTTKLFGDHYYIFHFDVCLCLWCSQLMARTWDFHPEKEIHLNQTSNFVWDFFNIFFHWFKGWDGPNSWFLEALSEDPPIPNESNQTIFPKYGVNNRKQRCGNHDLLKKKETSIPHLDLQEETTKINCKGGA